MRHGLILIVGALAALGCGRLGLWQLDRLAERRAANAVVEVQRARPVVTLSGAEWDGADSLADRRATAAGRFDFDHQIVVWLRPLNGVPGVHVVTPLLLDDSTAVLVERGWLPSPDGMQADLALASEPAAAVVEGVLWRSGASALVPADTARFPLGLRSPDPAVVRSRVPYRVWPLVLRRTGTPDGPAAVVAAVPLAPLDEGSHRSYAVQWFAFATIALVGSIALYRKQVREAGSVA